MATDQARPYLSHRVGVAEGCADGAATPDEEVDHHRTSQQCARLLIGCERGQFAEGGNDFLDLRVREWWDYQLEGLSGATLDYRVADYLLRLVSRDDDDLDVCVNTCIDDVAEVFALAFRNGVRGVDDDQTNRSAEFGYCLLYTSPSPRDRQKSRMPSSA